MPPDRGLTAVSDGAVVSGVVEGVDGLVVSGVVEGVDGVVVSGVVDVVGVVSSPAQPASNKEAAKITVKATNNTLFIILSLTSLRFLKIGEHGQSIYNFLITYLTSF
jgi:hypothetical protein